jgi:hypothetical protein
LWSNSLTPQKNLTFLSLRIPISTVTVNGHLEQVTSTHMINALRDAVGVIGEVKLAIKKEDVGTHLIRLGTAMAISVPKF